MIVPKIVSHVQPSGRDYSGTTSPDLITEIPAPLQLSPVEAFAQVAEPSLNLWWAEPEAGRTTVGGALLLLAACFLAGLFVALSMLGADIQNGGDTFTTWTDRNFR